MRVCGTCREIEIGQFGQPRVFVTGNGHHLAAVQAELAGEAQDLFRLAGDGKHDRQRVTGHIVSHRKIGVINMITKFPDVGEEAGAIFRQRARGACADENNTFGGENNIDGLLE